MHIIDRDLPLHYDSAISSDGQVAIFNFILDQDFIYTKCILVSTPQKEIDIQLNSTEIRVKMSGEALIYAQSIITPDDGEVYIKLEVIDSFTDLFWTEPNFDTINLLQAEEDSDLDV